MKKTTDNLFLKILVLISILTSLFAHFVLLWFWGGDGLFTLLTTPVCYASYLLAAIFLMRKYKQKRGLLTALKCLIFVLLPLLTMLTVYLLAVAFGITVHIH